MNFRLKRLYRFILKSFLPLFLLTFIICLFLVLMQFLWKYVEDMVGKGIEMNVLSEMFLYAALNLIPLALPLAILLASLMTFGNFGERLELLAMKSAGIPLLKMMKPLIVLIAFISIGAFFFQNNAMPKIQVKFYSLLLSIRQKSPELDIPEGTFYKEIENYSLYVGHKDRSTGTLHDVMIYDISKGFNNIAVIVCDSALMRMSKDRLSLVFTMYHGQQFQNFQSESASRSNNSGKFVPYSRENFKRKEMLIPFDANFNRIEDSMLAENEGSSYISKNINQLRSSIDSMTHKVDSINRIDRTYMARSAYLSFRNAYKSDSTVFEKAQQINIDPLDSILAKKSLQEKTVVYSAAASKAENNVNDFTFRSLSKVATQNTINRHWIELNRKFTLSFACLIFFFIGAPLGSIIRKGGLGTPIVVSVILFIIYYIIDNIGYKMTRDGVWPHYIGMWFSSIILFPLGVFLTYKAMNDSVILNADAYRNFFRKVFFIREKRNYSAKEIVIQEPNYSVICANLQSISEEIDAYLLKYQPIHYRTFWMDDAYDVSLISIKMQLDNTLNEVSNSKKRIILSTAEEYPMLISVQRPFKAGSAWARITMYVLPVGWGIRLLSLLFEKRIHNDLKRIKKLNTKFKEILNERTLTEPPKAQ